MDLPRVVIFDLDGTLALSKSPIADSTAMWLVRLLANADVCIISGATYEQMQTQVLGHLEQPADLGRLHLMPTCGTQYYRYDSGAWIQVYSESLDAATKNDIADVLTQGAHELGLTPKQSWGPLIEDRETQITYSGLGQQAPVAAKLAWDPDGAKKEHLRAYAAERLPDLEVHAGGSTSIDVTRRGIDKAYGVTKLAQQLGLTLKDMLFLGDRLDEGGNDFPVKRMGVRCIPVTGWQDTETHIAELITQFDTQTTTQPTQPIQPHARPPGPPSSA